MSSDRIERKRRSEFDTSDNSADESPAVKIRRVDSTVAINIVKKLTGVCKNLFNWLTPNFLKSMAVRVSRQSSSLRTRENNLSEQYPIDVDDDDDEVTFVGAQNGAVAHSRPVNAFSMDSHARGSRTRNSSICPLASTQSYPLSRENSHYVETSQTVQHSKMNGFPSGAYNNGEGSRPRRSERRSAPMTNPPCEIEILLGEDIEDDEEIEIINPTCSPKNLSGPSRKMRLQNNSRGSRNNRASAVRSNLSASSPYCTRNYTANEVVRLQEKAQYRLLLDKIINRPPLFKPAFPRKDRHASVTQIDLTEDDASEEERELKREKLQKDVNEYFSKYYKPCPLVPYITRNSQSPNDEESSDDDIQIMDYPQLPKLKPMKPPDTYVDYFSEEWLAKLRINVQAQTEKVLQDVSQQQKKLERYKKRRDAKLAEEKRFKDEQRLLGVVFPEDVIMEAETLPEITPEMNNIIDKAYASPTDTRLAIIKNLCGEDIVLYSQDIVTLLGSNWLNDQIITFYLTLIERRNKLDGFPTIYIYNTFFYSRMKRSGNIPRMLRWTKKIDIFSYDLLVMPLHLEVHWALLVIDNRTKEMKYYDSMSSGESQCLNLIQQYLILEMMDKKKIVLDPTTYSAEIAKDIPKQMNGSDCGMFTLKYAEYLTRDAPLTFTQNDMPYFRRRMVYELITHQIL